MSDLVRRSRILSLRLSDAEYEALKAQYSKHGARSVSELTRLAIHNLVITSTTPAAEIAGRIADLEERLRALETDMSSLTGRNVYSQDP